MTACCALLDIVDGRLYEQVGCRSFREYVEESGRVQIGMRHATALVGAARVLRSLPEGVPWPTCERQVRPLLGCDRGVAERVWAINGL